MPSYYEHLLIRTDHEYRPSPNAIARFLDGIIENGHVTSGARIEFAEVTRRQSPTRMSRNPFTGKMFEVRAPRRVIGKPESIASVSTIAARAASALEFDVSVGGHGKPKCPPCVIGHFFDDVWKPFMANHSLTVTCRVRSCPVYLSPYESEADFDLSLDYARFFRLREGEDCTTEETDGLFVHPEAGNLRITGASCSTFWISFHYSHWLFPRAERGSVDALSPEVTRLAMEHFGTGFIQACHWG